MGEDAEIKTMQQAASAIAQLDEAAQRRVLTWLCDKFNVILAKTTSNGQPLPSDEVVDKSAYETFADLFHAVGPKFDREKAVTAAYWMKLEGAAQFQSMELNAKLKNLGHGIGNITDAISSAMREKPALIIQLRKSGSSRQARKSYKVTDAGCKWVESRLAQEAEQ